MGALQYTLSPEEWLDQVLILKKDREAPSNLKERVIAMGYEAVTQVVQLGQFAMRGGILDIASPGSPSGPVRLEFFGDNLESVRPLDILNQRSSGNLEEVHIFPAHEIVLKDETRYNLRQALKAKIKQGSEESSSRWATDALELFNQTHQFPGWQWQAVGALEKKACLFDYLPKDARIFLLEPLAFERKWEELQEVLAGCNQQAQEDGADLFDAQELFSNTQLLSNALLKGKGAALAQIHQDLFGKPPDFAHPVPGRSFPPYYGKFSTFTTDLKKWLSTNAQVLLWCHNRGERERLSELLKQEGIAIKDNPQLLLPLGEIEQGFAFDDINLRVLPDHDLFRRYRGRRRRRVRSVSGGNPWLHLMKFPSATGPSMSIVVSAFTGA